MKAPYGISDYGETEQRLRSGLSLEGQVPVDLDLKVVPIFVVGDGTTPGMAAQRNRRFVRHQSAVISGTTIGIRATADVVIERVDFMVETAAATLGFRYQAPNVADIFALALAQCLFLDRGSGDFAPVVSDAAISASLSNAGQIGAVIGAMATWEYPFCLAAGAQLYLRVLGVGTSAGVSIYGRTF